VSASGDSAEVSAATSRIAAVKAVEAGFGDRVSCEVATAQDVPADGYDLVTFFDCLHDLGDPEGALRYVE
jgi:hypothetical protein